ncbi:hypothetical protein [Peptostreptococcus porci]|uniref:hypothetical protein n=1 Tax=Peptostreptococcus porci TaxID=2652282 RepID=UPI002A80A639|nr:hypothetical protein [Peptostreptococcus porci]MDY4128433.1 hypothetical protein [Peptostreptococcus porci]
MNKLKRSGFILLNMLIYIAVIAVVLAISAVLIKESTSKYNHFKDELELREIAYSIEDTIRVDLNNLVGVIYHSRVRDKDDYIQIRELVYDVYSKDNKETVVRRKISLEYGILYISQVGKYQIGNYVEKIYYKKNVAKSNKYMEFFIVLKKNKTRIEHRFIIFLNNFK